MAVHQFGLETLTELDDGRVVVGWNQAIARAVADCEDRPALKKPRTVTLELTLEPVLDAEQPVLDSVEGSFRIMERVPRRTSKRYSFGVRKTGKQLALCFNDLSDDDIHQRTIDEI